MRASWLLLVPLLLSTGARAQDYSELDAAAGQALFERNWVPAPASTAAADGLGPYYNARSCAACHPGGNAGSGPVAINLVVDDPVYGHLLQLRAITGLEQEASANISYMADDSVTLADGTRVGLNQPLVDVSGLRQGPLSSSVSLRRAPALGGLSLLEQVPLETLNALADPEDRNGDGISGRVADGNGRFGWKAGTDSLRAQTARALSLDIGLGNPLFPAAAGDCTAVQTACLQAARALTGASLEAPEIVLNLLLRYLQSLPVPAAQPPADAPEAALFSSLGCAACHRPQLQTGDMELHPYSDLLIHDMGTGLAAGADSPAATASEWRTAPLWGLGRSTRFLHDGRAATMAEAILWHDGEAAASAAAYRNLSEGERERLHKWLHRL